MLKLNPVVFMNEQSVLDFPQFTSIPKFVSLANDSLDQVAYIRDFWRSWYAPLLSGSVYPDLEVWIDQYNPSFGALPLADVDSTLAIYPQTIRENLEKQIQQLQELLNEFYPLAPNEHIDASKLTVITEQIDGCRPGTVVYIRQTNLATIHFLLNHIVLDFKSGKPYLVGLIPPLPAPRVEQLIIQSDSGKAIASGCLEIAGCLVWALPTPFGAISAAVITGFELLLGGSNQIVEAIEQATKEIETTIWESWIIEHKSTIETFSSWLSGKSKVIEAVYGDKPLPNDFILSKQGYKNGFLDDLNTRLLPVESAITSIKNIIEVSDPYDDHEYSALYAIGCTLYLTGLKMKLQLEAQVAGNYKDVNNLIEFDEWNQTWRDSYSFFEIKIYGFDDFDGLAKEFTGMIDSFYKKRLDNITELYRYCWIENQTMINGWTWKDNFNNDNDLTNFVGDTADNCCSKRDTQHKDIAQQNHDNWVKTVRESLDKKYESSREIIKKWEACIYDFNEHLPPMAPKKSPSIRGWRGSPPAPDDEKNWLNGNEVGYAVSFDNNQNNPSPKTPDSAKIIYKPIQSDRGTSIEIPIDPLKMAMSFRVYRYVRNNKTLLTNSELVGSRRFDSSFNGTFQDAGPPFIALWIGKYDQKIIYDPLPEKPNLKIQKNDSTGGYQVFLNDIEIKNWKFDNQRYYDNDQSILSWSQSDGNLSAANLEFKDKDYYQCFSGTLEIGGGSTSKDNPKGNFSGQCINSYIDWWRGKYSKNLVYKPLTKIPILTIQENISTGKYQVLLDDIEIKNWYYDPHKAVLSWTQADGNKSAATLEFTIKDNQRYFSGTLETVSSKKDSFSGKTPYLGIWIGKYDQEIKFNPSTEKPTLAIQEKDSTGKFQVLLNDIEIKNWYFDEDKSELSWPKTDGNLSSAILTFKIKDSCQYFNGTLEVGGDNTDKEYVKGSFSGKCIYIISMDSLIGEYNKDVKFDHWAQKPILTIKKNIATGKYQVFLNDSEINKWDYDTKKGVLTWPQTDGNWSAASLEFTIDDYLKCFSGTLTMDSQGFPFSGKCDQ